MLPIGNGAAGKCYLFVAKFFGIFQVPLKISPLVFWNEICLNLKS